MAKNKQTPIKPGVTGLSVETVYRVAGKEFRSPQEAQQYLTNKAQEAEAGRAKKLTSAIMSRVRANRRSAVREGVEYLVGLLLRDSALYASFQPATVAAPMAPKSEDKAPPIKKPAPAAKPAGKAKDQPKPQKAGTKKATAKGAGTDLDALPPPSAGGPPPPPPDIVKASQASA